MSQRENENKSYVLSNKSSPQLDFGGQFLWQLKKLDAYSLKPRCLPPIWIPAIIIFPNSKIFDLWPLVTLHIHMTFRLEKGRVPFGLCLSYLVKVNCPQSCARKGLWKTACFRWTGINDVNYLPADASRTDTAAIWNDNIHTKKVVIKIVMFQDPALTNILLSLLLEVISVIKIRMLDNL